MTKQIVLKLHVVKRILADECKEKFMIVHEDASSTVTRTMWIERLDLCVTWEDLEEFCHDLYRMDLQAWANSL